MTLVMTPLGPSTVSRFGSRPRFCGSRHKDGRLARASVVGGVDSFDGQEREEGVCLIADMFEQLPVGVMADRTDADVVEAGRQLGRRGRPVAEGKVTGGEAVEEDRFDRRGYLRSERGRSASISWHRLKMWVCTD